MSTALQEKSADTSIPAKKTRVQPHYKSLYEEQKKENFKLMKSNAVGWILFIGTLLILIGRSL